jgi:hypothetical protein
LKCIFLFNQTFAFDPAQQPAVIVEGDKPDFLKKNQGLVTLGLNLRVGRVGKNKGLVTLSPRYV